MKEDSKTMTFIENKFTPNYNEFNQKTDSRTDRKTTLKTQLFFAETQTWGSADSNKSVGTCYNEKEKNNDYLCRKRLQ